jgi:hypothetical protein
MVSPAIEGICGCISRNLESFRQSHQPLCDLGILHILAAFMNIIGKISSLNARASMPFRKSISPSISICLREDSSGMSLQSNI